ncbi:hypothetical protein Leryth_016902 [Lithospermum erythrorhizon]|nr:hypothetical protein Leryth_016902 [Lithospermum erythrorhizon]
MQTLMASSRSELPDLDQPSSFPFSVPDPFTSRVKPTTVRHLSESPNPPNKNIPEKSEVNLMNGVTVGVSTIMIYSSVVLLILLCCCIAFKRRSVGKKDDRPLLSLSLSDNSSASSNSYYYGASSTHKEQCDQSFADAPNHYELCDKFKLLPLKVQNSTEIGSAESLYQKPPAISGSPGLPTLNPPPGRPGKSAPPPPPPPVVSNAPPPPLPPGKKKGPPPPPPPRNGGPHPPPMGLKATRSSLPNQGHQSTNAESNYEGADASRTKLKPFFWDKVQANSDDSMVWNKIKEGSFQFNEEMIESLFGYASSEKSKKPSASQDNANESIQLIEPKKAQNLAILLKALNVTTEEICDALQEGNELPAGLLQTLLKMAPTPEEELKLRLYDGEVSRLGNAERFLKVVIEIPFSFMRLESLLFMCTLQEEEPVVRESFATLEAACTELRKNRLFLKLLEAVLKTGNRMNDGTFRGDAQAFKLDTLLKLSDVKGKDGKTTLLHFVVQEIIRTEGIKAFRTARDRRSFNSIKSDELNEDSSEDSEDEYRELGLQAVSSIGNDLENVKRAAILDSDGLSGTVAKFGNSLVKAKNFLNSEMKNVDEDNGFNQVLKGFVEGAEAGIMHLLEEEKRIMALVKSTADYFHGTAGKEEGLRIFAIVRDFLVLLDKICREIKVAPKKSFRNKKREDFAPARQIPSSDPRKRLAPKITERRVDSSSSDEET